MGRSPPPRPLTLATGQVRHVVLLLLLLAIVCVCWIGLGRPQPVAFWIAVAIPVLHQGYVWLTWRLELLRGSISRWLGFERYLVVFIVLLLGRPLSLAWLAWVDRYSIDVPLLLQAFTVFTLSALAGYTVQGVHRHFGIRRAAGADHFEARYRDMPPVSDGVFRLTSNAMYVFGFLLLWAIAFALCSSAALVVAAFSHAYIWVHYVCTERPDMRYLYDPRSPASHRTENVSRSSRSRTSSRSV